jgi:Leucine-rich repeat (LRR) protein
MVYQIKYHNNKNKYSFDNISEIVVLTNQDMFNCRNNSLTELPFSIDSLTYFNYDNNRLTELPSTIGQLTNLKAF